MTESAAQVPPIVPFLKTDANGPYLCGARCEACGRVFVGERTVCAACSARGRMTPVRLAETGRVWVHTLVCRSFPGVATPFIDAIVDLDDGAHLKGTLIGVPPEQDAVPYDLPVKVVFREATPVNRPGETYLTYAFTPLDPVGGPP